MLFGVFETAVALVVLAAKRESSLCKLIALTHFASSKLDQMVGLMTESGSLSQLRTFILQLGMTGNFFIGTTGFNIDCPGGGGGGILGGPPGGPGRGGGLAIVASLRAASMDGIAGGAGGAGLNEVLISSNLFKSFSSVL